ncbi:DUF3574 domain-containing protein [Enterobacter sp. EA-1]|nr:DUF3574 domain-containing protein [Enterobacter sp. EA-1]
MKLKTGFTALVMAGVLAGCVAPAPKPVATAAVQSCKADNQMQQTTLYFGLSRPAGKAITGQEWQQFVDGDVTPRFREGLTVFDARGQWLGNDGKVAREESKALMLIHGTDAQSEAKIKRCAAFTNRALPEESVMRVDQPVCVQF